MIAIENLSVDYGDYSVFGNINLKIEKQDYLAIIGPNGSGKTTLIKCILGLETDFEGKIKFEDKYKFGYVAQQERNSTDLPLTVEEYLKLVEPTKSKLQTIIEHLQLQKLLRHQVSRLSGGQYQLVMIAKALLNNVDILVLDEPITGLDRATKEKFHNLVKQLHQDGITIIVITHNLDEIIGHVNKVYDLETREYESDVSRTCEFC